MSSSAAALLNRVQQHRYIRLVKLSIAKITTPLFWRVVIFLGLFVLISGLMGPRIINSDILFRDGFGIYGGLGKAAIFGLIAFVLLVRTKGFGLKLAPWQPSLLAWIAVSCGFFVIAWMNISSLLAGDRTAAHITLAHAGLILSIASAAVACIGPSNMRLLWRTYRREILMAGAIAGLFYVFLLGVYALWKPLASIVLAGVYGLSKLVGLPAEIIQPNVLITDKFGITIAEYCSGIESIALFTGLYIVVGLLEWERLNLRRYLLLFPLALAVLFGLNIVRVFALIAAGYYLNQEIAFSLFHTYAGMIFFIIYSAIFWAIAYKYLIKEGDKGGAKRGKGKNTHA